MNRLRLVSLLALALAPIALGQEEPVEPPTDRLVVIVSVDGLRPDAIAATDTPTFDRLIAGGTRATDCRTILPSSTLPSHTSMLTGLKPSRHGVVLWNSRDESRGPIKATTCLELAGRAGYETTMVVGKDKLWHLSRGVDHYERPAYEARTVVEAAVRRFREAPRPGLAFLHLADPDGAGHRHGWMSQEQLAAVRDVDGALALLLEGLEAAGLLERTTLLVSADHGGHGETHGTWLDVDMHIPWIAWGRGVREGHAFERRITTYDTAATALDLLGVEVPADWDGKPVAEIAPEDE